MCRECDCDNATDWPHRQYYSILCFCPFHPYLRFYRSRLCELIRNSNEINLVLFLYRPVNGSLNRLRGTTYPSGALPLFHSIQRNNSVPLSSQLL